MASAQRPALKQSPAWRGHFRSQFKKTKMCRYYPMGMCKFAKECCFAHSADELSQAPDLTKTSMCTAFMSGKCPLPSEDCQYAHSEEELRVTPAFVAKKLSRRTREATEASSPQDPEPEETKFDWSARRLGSRASSGALSEADRTTEPPNSPLRRLSSGISTPVSSASPAVGTPVLPSHAKGKTIVCLSDVMGLMVGSEQGGDASRRKSPTAHAPSPGEKPSYGFPGGSLPPPAAWPPAGMGAPFFAFAAPPEEALHQRPPSSATGSTSGASGTLTPGNDRSNPDLELARIALAEVGPGEAAKVPMPSFDYACFPLTLEVDPIILAARRSNLPLRVDI